MIQSDLCIKIKRFQASAQRHTNFYACCREPYLDITFTIVIRRKTLFYTGKKDNLLLIGRYLDI